MSIDPTKKPIFSMQLVFFMVKRKIFTNKNIFPKCVLHVRFKVLITESTISLKRPETRWMGIESVLVVEAISHADTLEISHHSPTRVLLPALESMESKRHTSY